MITDKKDKSVKIALDSKKLNDAIQKKQTPNAKHRPLNGFGSTINIRKKKQTKANTSFRKLT